MKRPLSDFFPDERILRAQFLSTRASETLCFQCEEPLGDHRYHVSSSFMCCVTVCTQCMLSLQADAHKRQRERRKPIHHDRPHFDPKPQDERR